MPFVINYFGYRKFTTPEQAKLQLAQYWRQNSKVRDPQNIDMFVRAGYEKRVYKDEDPVNLQAAELMGKLHDCLKEIGYMGHDLEVYLVRLLFCLFADDHRECASLMLIGHNPGMEHLVALLTSGQSGDFRGLPAAGLVVLHIPADAEFEPGIATLEHFWWP